LLTEHIGLCCCFSTVLYPTKTGEVLNLKSARVKLNNRSYCSWRPIIQMSREVGSNPLELFCLQVSTFRLWHWLPSCLGDILILGTSSINDMRNILLKQLTKYAHLIKTWFNLSQNLITKRNLVTKKRRELFSLDKNFGSS